MELLIIGVSTGILELYSYNSIVEEPLGHFVHWPLNYFVIKKTTTQQHRAETNKQKMLWVDYEHILLNMWLDSLFKIETSQTLPSKQSFELQCHKYNQKPIWVFLKT